MYAYKLAIISSHFSKEDQLTHKIRGENCLIISIVEEFMLTFMQQRIQSGRKSGKENAKKPY